MTETEPTIKPYEESAWAKLEDAAHAPVEVSLRLLETLTSPLEARVLGPGIVREICYRVLIGEQGAAMRAALTSQGQFGRIAKALRRIHADYSADIDVGILAAEASMSVPAWMSA